MCLSKIRWSATGFWGRYESQTGKSGADWWKKIRWGILVVQIILLCYNQDLKHGWNQMNRNHTICNGGKLQWNQLYIIPSTFFERGITGTKGYVSKTNRISPKNPGIAFKTQGNAQACSGAGQFPLALSPFPCAAAQIPGGIDPMPTGNDKIPGGLTPFRVRPFAMLDGIGPKVDGVGLFLDGNAQFPEGRELTPGGLSTSRTC